jgi:hypothetical protein
MVIDQLERAVREKLADLCEKQAELTSEGRGFTEHPLLLIAAGIESPGAAALLTPI